MSRLGIARHPRDAVSPISLLSNCGAQPNGYSFVNCGSEPAGKTAEHSVGAQRLDAFALNTLPHTAMKRVCYTVKTSRGDFLAELKRPLKRRIGMRYSNEFYFVPRPISSTPRNSGRLRTRGSWLCDVCRMEATDQPPRRLLQLRSRKTSVLHDHDSFSVARYAGPTWQLVAAMLRNQPNAATARTGVDPIGTRAYHSDVPTADDGD